MQGERLNTFSHLAALLGCLLAAAALLRETVQGGDVRKTLAALVFAVCTVLLYGASALFHGSAGARKKVWERADHAGIYLLIAGSHTPFALSEPPAAGAWVGLAAVWALALWCGGKALRTDLPPPLALYVGLGWLGLGAAVPAALRDGGITLAWLFAGGAFYTAGTLFYRRFAGLRHAHGIWHLFVVAGTASHWVAVFRLLA
ncbi:MAG: hemolysin III family protein [Comamonadaceae bacterium]|nr:MAG: hemolysin III family protein [Comamonadaceae bacterium]